MATVASREVRRLLGEVDRGELVEAHEVVGDHLGRRGLARCAAGPRPSRPSSPRPRPAPRASGSSRCRSPPGEARPGGRDGRLGRVGVAGSRGTGRSPSGVHKLTRNCPPGRRAAVPYRATTEGKRGARASPPGHSAPAAHVRQLVAVEAQRPSPVAVAGGCRLSGIRPFVFRGPGSCTQDTLRKDVPLSSDRP